MRYRDLTEALQEPDWDTIKSWAKLYGKKHGINPNYILGLFNHESMIKDVYHPVGDQTFLQDIKDKWKHTKNPEGWKDNPYVKAYGDNPEAHMSYGPGHFSVRALTKVQNSHPELKIGEKNVKDITWNDLKKNNELAAELSVLHFSDLYNDSDNQGSDDEKLLNAYTAIPGSYRGKDNNSSKFGKQFMASINKFADNPFPIAKASTGSGYDKMKWKGQEKMAKAIAQYFKRIFDDYQVLVMVNPSDFTGTELILRPDGKVEKTEMEFDEEIFEDLAEDEFQTCSPLEFQLLLAKS